MIETRRIYTSPEVVAVIRARHGDDLRVYGAYTRMDEGLIYTDYALNGSTAPLFGIETKWDPERERTETEANRYWLFAVTNSA